MKSNPFATRFAAPGRIPWFGTICLESIAERFHSQSHFAASIVGPHGSGKSTLLEHLVPQLGKTCLRIGPGWETTLGEGEVIWLRLRKGHQVLGPNGLRLTGTQQLLKASQSYWRPGCILVLDGFEQLSSLSRLFWMWRVRMCQMRLLATSHRPMPWMPLLLETNSSLELAREIVEFLVRNQSVSHRQECLAKVETFWLSNQGNLREMLMQHFDQFQQMTREESVVVS